MSLKILSTVFWSGGRVCPASFARHLQAGRSSWASFLSGNYSPPPWVEVLTASLWAFLFSPLSFISYGTSWLAGWPSSVQLLCALPDFSLSQSRTRVTWALGPAALKRRRNPQETDYKWNKSILCSATLWKHSDSQGFLPVSHLN